LMTSSAPAAWAALLNAFLAWSAFSLTASCGKGKQRER
jgi:hypothetical protein